MNNYGYTKAVGTSLEQAIEDITFSLAAQGFGILTTIDMQSKVKEKLGKDMEPYMILWACNPGLAHQAVQAEHEIGLFLPCNIIVYQKQSQVFISTILPTSAMSVIQNPTVDGIAQTAEAKLKQAIDQVWMD